MCPYCLSWYATDEKILANRIRNLADGGRPSQCPRCGSDDWATSARMVGRGPPPKFDPAMIKYGNLVAIIIVVLLGIAIWRIWL